MIEIRFYGPFREPAGQKTVKFDPGKRETIESALRSLSADRPELIEQLFEDGQVRESINVIKNGKNIKLLKGGDTPVDDGDQLSVTGPLEGG